MSHFVGNLATSTNGNQAFTGIGFQPTFMRLSIGKKNSGGADNNVRYAVGATDGAAQYNHWVYQDGSGSRTVTSNSRCIGTCERVSGVLTDKCDASIVSFDADGFTLNFSNADSNYDIWVECEN